jgi:nicotinamidase-related amidase
MTEPGTDHVELDQWGSNARSFLERRGFGVAVPPGLVPAVIVIDLSKAFTDPTSPVGSDLDAVVAATAKLLDAARRGGLPVFFFSLAFMPDYSDGGTLVAKQPATRLLVEGSSVVEIDGRLAPRRDEPVVIKKAASCFFGTSLASSLVKRHVDTVILAGVSTSGCVRATAVDGQSYGFHVMVPRECVGDRTPEAHDANLFDIQVKIGEVVSLEEALVYLATINRAGQART